jgi:hypothetical protein
MHEITYTLAAFGQLLIGMAVVAAVLAGTILAGALMTAPPLAADAVTVLHLIAGALRE